MEALEGLAVLRGERFAAAVRAVAADPTLLPGVGSRIAKAWATVESAASELSAVTGSVENIEISVAQLKAALGAAAALLELPTHAITDIMNLAGETESASLSELLSKSSTVGERLEPQLSTDSVNIMTMHQAKGLTFDCVLIPGLEDELLPGRYDDPDQEGDERRLLYVSMTRARHALVLLYATRRTGVQAHSGRVPVAKDRSLTRFLADYKFKKD